MVEIPSCNMPPLYSSFMHPVSAHPVSAGRGRAPGPLQRSEHIQYMGGKKREEVDGWHVGGRTRLAAPFLPLQLGTAFRFGTTTEQIMYYTYYLLASVHCFLFAKLPGPVRVPKTARQQHVPISEFGARQEKRTVEKQISNRDGPVLGKVSDKPKAR
jgi:hypothetical protein